MTNTPAPQLFLELVDIRPQDVAVKLRLDVPELMPPRAITLHLDEVSAIALPRHPRGDALEQLVGPVRRLLQALPTWTEGLPEEAEAPLAELRWLMSTGPRPLDPGG